MSKAIQLAAFVFAALGLFGLVEARLDQIESFDCKGPRTVVATHGDTVWRIAETNCTGNVRTAVDEIIRLNGGSGLQVGQIVRLP